MKKIFQNVSFYAIAISLCCATLACNSKNENKDGGTQKVTTETTDSVVIESRMKICDAIDEWERCNVLALSENHGNLALKDNNNYVQSECPEDLVKALEELKKENQEVVIKDVVITESGNWLVLADKNTVVYNGIPEDFAKELKNFHEKNEEIVSLGCNTLGDWVILTDKSFCTSDKSLDKEIEQGEKEFGKLQSVCVSESSIAIIYENGYNLFGDSNEELEKALTETEMDIRQIEVSEDSWFIADEEGNFNYNIVTYE